MNGRTVVISANLLLLLMIEAEFALRKNPVCRCIEEAGECFNCRLANALKEARRLTGYGCEVPDLKKEENLEAI